MTDHPPAHAHGHHDHPAGMHGRAWSRAEAIAALESPDRTASQDPEALWDVVGLRPGETVVDVGAGTGYFAFPAARRVGAAGRVYAVDLSDDLVDLLQERARTRGVPQLTAVHSALDRISLADGVADVVLLANVLHDIPVTTLQEAVRLLRPTGRFVNIDWKKRDTPGGPPIEVRLTEEEARDRLARVGLAETRRWEFGPHHYGLLLRRATR